MDTRQILACLILLLIGVGLFQLQSVFWRKFALLFLWMASGLAAYSFSGSYLMAGVMLGAWIFFPAWEMLFILRQLRVPRQRKLADARPPRDDFEELGELTEELRDLGYRQVDECRLVPAPHEQYYRIFLRPDGLVYGMVGYIAQGSIGFHFLAFTSLGQDGRRWVTWDYPLTYGLVMPPEIAVYRALHCQSVADLEEAHVDFLEVNEVPLSSLVVHEATPEAARARLEQTLNQQIEYNISRGYLAPASVDTEESFRYSWRGTLYVAGQVMRDLLF